MSGKIIAGGIVAIALIFGALVYYLQEYYYYEELDPATEEVVLTLVDGTGEAIQVEDLRAIDANSSPIRYRACFTTPLGRDGLAATHVPYEKAEPLIAPHWFDCFDAKEVGEALEEGRASAFLGTRNIHHGVDRVVAVLDDGRGFVWHQVNEEIAK